MSACSIREIRARLDRLTGRVPKTPEGAARTDHPTWRRTPTAKGLQVDAE